MSSAYIKQILQSVSVHLCMSLSSTVVHFKAMVTLEH